MFNEHWLQLTQAGLHILMSPGWWVYAQGHITPILLEIIVPINSSLYFGAVVSQDMSWYLLGGRRGFNLFTSGNLILYTDPSHIPGCAGSGSVSASDSESNLFICVFCLSKLPSEESTMSAENVPATNILIRSAREGRLSDLSHGTWLVSPRQSWKQTFRWMLLLSVAELYGAVEPGSWSTAAVIYVFQVLKVWREFWQGGLHLTFQSQIPILLP